MKIVATDAFTLNGGDLSWEKISALGELVLYDRTAPEMIIERCIDADIVLTNKVAFKKETLEHLPRLKFIAVLATGYNVIDVDAAGERGVIVANVPGYGSASVAQHVFALLLELTNHVGRNSGSTAKGDWQHAADWCYSLAPIQELDGKTFGVVGFGNIGQRAARIAATLGMKIIYHNRTEKNAAIGAPVSLETVFSESNVISLHCSTSADNIGFVNRQLLATMKPDAYLINTARGQLINEQDLADALNNQVIAGAALDVLSAEPPSATNPLLRAANCIITPHNAWMSKEARERIMEMTAANIAGFLSGNLINVVGGTAVKRSTLNV